MLGKLGNLDVCGIVGLGLILSFCMEKASMIIRKAVGPFRPTFFSDH